KWRAKAGVPVCSASPSCPALHELELRLHRLRERVGARQRAHHNDELVDRAALVEVQEVAALDLLLADTGAEDERMVACAGAADLADVAKVLEHLRYGREQHPHDLAATIGLEHDRAAELDIVGDQRDGGIDVAGLNCCAKRVHSDLL